MKIGKNMFDLEKALEINSSSPFRVYETPMGAAPGDTITVGGKSVPWKGIKGRDAIMKYRTPNGKSIWNGLKKCIEASQATRGITGTTVLIYPDQTRKIVPAKSAAMAMNAHPGYYGAGKTKPAKKPWLRAGAPAAAQVTP